MSKRNKLVRNLRFVSLFSGMVLLASCAPFFKGTQRPSSKAIMGNIIPAPVSISASGDSFMVQADTKIFYSPNVVDVRAVGQHLVERLKPATGFLLSVSPSDSSAPNTILLTTKGAESSLGDEGYLLKVSGDRIVIVANTAAGLFYGVQTIRQMLPADIENTVIRPGPWRVATGTIRDEPRFAWRGAMLDVARSFFTVDNVKRYLDLMAYYKLNRFHIHLADDQGWRIEIKSWPKLALRGGDNSVSGGNKGFYTQKDFGDIVAYAQSRFITVVPEIDMPGHVNAALSCYPELNANDTAPAPYSGIEVGFSSLAIHKEITYKFVDDVVKELAAMTPGPYLHIGGDEAQKTSETDYIRFMERAYDIVASHGKRAVGWGEIAKIKQASNVVAQHWIYDNDSLAKMAADKGAKLVMSPANKVYLDMKYKESTALGQDWAGLVEVCDSYSWDPADFVKGVPETSILGVEAPLWSETLRSMRDVEYMAFPRLAGIAEIGWSPGHERNWKEYKLRLAAHGARWTSMGVNFYRSKQVPW